MGSKLFIFVLFGTLFQISLASDVCPASSSSIQSLMCTISHGRRVTTKSYDTALDNIFVGLIIEAKILLGIIEEFDGLPAYIATLKNNAIDALWECITTTVNVVVTIGPADPPINPADLSAVKAKIEALVNGIFAAIDLCKVPGTTQVQVEDAVQKLGLILIDIFKFLFDFMKIGRECSVALSAINEVENKVLTNLQILSNAISDAMVILLRINVSKTAVPPETVLAELAVLESFIRSGFKDEANNKYQLLRVIALYTALNSPEIAGDFATIQLAEKNLVAGWNAALQPIALLLSTIYQCSDVAGAVESIRYVVLEGLKATNAALLPGIEIIRYANSPAISLDESAIHAALRKLVALILDSIVIAHTADSTCLAEIEVNEAEVISETLSFISDQFKLIAAVSSQRIDIANEIALTQKLTSASVENVYRAIFAVIKFINQNKTVATSDTSQSFNLLIEGTELALLAGVQKDVSFKSGLLRSLFVRKSLCVNGIFLDSCVNNDLVILSFYDFERQANV